VARWSNGSVRIRGCLPSIREDLEEQGVLFLDMDSGLKKFPEIVKQYFGTVVPHTDNKFSALNTAFGPEGRSFTFQRAYMSKCLFKHISESMLEHGAV